MFAFIVTMIAFLFGGILKGAIGAGTPVIVIPIISIFFGVPHAVATFALPALASNIWQGWQYRDALADKGFILRLAGSAGVGALIGTFILASLPHEILSLIVGLLALSYVGVRLLKPDWSLEYGFARRIAVPVGLVAGILQGAAGISAPVSVPFLHALHLSRERFIATLSIQFIAMSVVQLPSLIGVGVMDWQVFLLSIVACIPLFLAMPIGAGLVKRFGVKLFDRLIMAMLFIIAVRLIFEALSGLS
ncbi:sulfite exporter TauE/SafE family protein [Paracoccus aerodenitrificans]|uniref:sulfite exporter TauE/SafE family protein n=1 Tax=Paracoccus aerodenitrificans TaxID=3017781 RepID=UPI0022F03EC2|nr:sulfite exporter TauE/SafE family protein [Paracoccus aerodenitrificans]WBU64206.1 sulfite exporter TauE/SafE family protein [Paracoccus aerodenitrificans]